MKEHPILFSGPMVRAILDGRKTQTRRVVTPQPAFAGVKSWSRGKWCETGPEDGDSWDFYVPETGGTYTSNTSNGPWRCRFGTAGDHLWVRETFCIESNFNVDSNEAYPPSFKDGRPVKETPSDGDWSAYWEQPHYRATDPEPEFCYENDDSRKGCKACGEGDPHAHWRPSIYMPRWASRLTLEVKAVRVERVCEISEADAIAEGIENLGDGVGKIEREKSVGYSMIGGLYAELWDSINAKRGYGWAANPWVWVIEFERVIEPC